MDKAESGALIDQKFLDNLVLIFIIDNLYMHDNGVGYSILRKMKFMEEAWDFNSIMFIPEYSIDLNKTRHLLEHRNDSDDRVSLKKGSRIINMYDYFQKSYGDDIKEAVEYKLDDKLEYREIGNNAYTVYDGPFHVRTEYYTGLGDRLRLVERLDGNGKKTKEIFYDDYGFISCIRTIDPANQEYHPVEYYYTTDRKPCIKVEYRFDNVEKPDELNPRNKIIKLTLYDDNGKVIKECADKAELAAYCLDKITSDKNKTYLIVDETGTYAKSLTLLNKPNIIKACLLHSAFLWDANDFNSGPQPFYQFICENHDHLDALIFLTEDERSDFIHLYGDRVNTFVIPHAYPHEIVKTDFENRDHRKVLIVSRFDPVKRLSIAIDIFKLVVAQVPDAKMEIYGFGTEGKKLTEHIQKLQLSDNVIIKGFTDNPILVFRDAAMHIMTSIVEGFGITTMESICNGCPAFAFDIKYGPSDIIKDGKTGYLIPNNNIEMYAQKMVSFLKHTALQKRFSENAYEDAERFTKETVLHKWYDFMVQVCKYNN